LSISHPPGKLKTAEKTRKGNSVENWKVEKLVKTGRRVQVQLNPGWVFTNILPGNTEPLHYMIFESEAEALAAVAAAQPCGCDCCKAVPGLSVGTHRG
jgi:hypothetical protein